MQASISTNNRAAWWTAGGDSSRSGRFRGTATIDCRPARRLAAQGAVQASVVFDGADVAYVADMAGGLQAFTPEGALRWRIRLAGGISATPVVHPDDQRLFVGTHAGIVSALDARDGRVVWQQDIPTEHDGRILSDLLYSPQHDGIVLSSWGGSFHLLAAESGNEQFRWDAGLSPSAAAAGDRAGNIYCVRAREGQGVQFVRVSSSGTESVLDEQPAGRKGAGRVTVGASPVVDEALGAVYFICNLDRGGRLFAWSLKREAILLGVDLQAAVRATPALTRNGRVVVADLGGWVSVLAPDGSPEFRYFSGSDYLLAGAVASDDAAWIGDPLGRLHAIDWRGAGRVVFEVARGIQARPSFDARGNLCVPATDGSVYVFPNRPA